MYWSTTLLQAYNTEALERRTLRQGGSQSSSNTAQRHSCLHKSFCIPKKGGLISLRKLAALYFTRKMESYDDESYSHGYLLLFSYWPHTVHWLQCVHPWGTIDVRFEWRFNAGMPLIAWFAYKKKKLADLLRLDEVPFPDFSIFVGHV